MIVLSLGAKMNANEIKIEVENISADSLEKIIGIPIFSPPSYSFNGYYWTDNSTMTNDFYFAVSDSGYCTYSEAVYTMNFIYSGSFNNNKKDNQWYILHHYNDGIDIYYKYKIKINFSDGKCIGSTYNGHSGYIMPFKTYSFDYCDPDSIITNVNRLWQKEWEEKYKNKVSN